MCVVRLCVCGDISVAWPVLMSQSVSNFVWSTTSPRESPLFAVHRDSRLCRLFCEQPSLSASCGGGVDSTRGCSLVPSQKCQDVPQLRERPETYERMSRSQSHPCFIGSPPLRHTATRTIVQSTRETDVWCL